MKAIREAILATLAYADVFNYPLRGEEVGKYLISYELRVTNYELKRQLDTLTEDKELGVKNGYYFLTGRKEIVELRKKREKWSRKKIEKAKKVANLLKVIPTVKLVGISGALAMENSDEDDDIDLFIITSLGRLWLTRSLVTVLVELTGQRRRPGVSLVNSSTSPIPQPLGLEILNPKGFSLARFLPNPLKNIRVNPRRRLKRLLNYLLPLQAAYPRQSRRSELPHYKDKICLNMFVDEDHLAVPPKERSLFTAHEVVQMKPLWFKDDVYQRFLAANQWVGKWLANSLECSNVQMFKCSKQIQNPTVKKSKPLYYLITNYSIASLLHCFIASLLNGLEKMAMVFQLKYMARRRTTEKISPGRILFHPEDKSRWVMGEYERRLKMKNKKLKIIANLSESQANLSE